ncbi:MAG: HEAT repeat domain-containing protein, partial [Tepidisphaeraceae bacterium]
MLSSCSRALALASVAFSTLAQPSPATRPAAAYDTAAPRKPGLLVEQSLQQLQNDDWILRWQAMEDLVALKTPAAIAPLSAIVSSPKEHPWPRSRALVAMARMGAPSALEQALNLAADKEPELRAGAVEALGILGSDRGLHIARERIADASPAVQAAALIAYARIGKAAAWDAVNAALAGDPKEAGFRAIVYVPTAAARQ